MGEKEKMDKVTANFNMTFNEGHFKKGNAYSYKCTDDNNSIIVTTEEGNKSSFTFGEFHILFSFLTK